MRKPVNKKARDKTGFYVVSCRISHPLAATELAAAGAEIVAGDMDNRAELDAAFKGAYGVFSVQTYWLPNVGFDGEVLWGSDNSSAAVFGLKQPSGSRGVSRPKPARQ